MVTAFVAPGGGPDIIFWNHTLVGTPHIDTKTNLRAHSIQVDLTMHVTASDKDHPPFTLTQPNLTFKITGRGGVISGP